MCAMRTLLIAAIISVTAGGCADDGASPRERLTTIAGTVVGLRDDFPVDGGAEILLRDDANGLVRRAYLPSIFTYPPPDEQTLDTMRRVMQVFHALEVGDHAIAQGVPDEGGLRMECLEAR